MINWLLDTLLWTAGLIALILLIRRPVARLFGPQLAYALWALPVIRVFLPPVTLPAWMAPAKEPVVNQSVHTGALDTPAYFVMPTDSVEATSGSWFAALPLIEIAVALWLTGAVYFLYSRFSGYAGMREEMLEGAKTVGHCDNVRLIETAATTSPLAFGVTEKVIALPVGFMAQSDIAARDLALEHELAHHSGHDLLANFIVQPLFALHWFNPLGHLGWLAMRRDQEAACDARVMQACEPEVRAAYANVIASFAAGPKVALAAPMACPVLGDKSIIHRLRSLKMSDLSNRRRLAGRTMIGAALIALPMTASISYAESAMPMAPDVPSTAIAAAVPIVPKAPGVPQTLTAAPIAPAAPSAPHAPPAPLAPSKWQALLDMGDHNPLTTATFAFSGDATSEDERHESSVHYKVEKRVEKKKDKDGKKRVERRIVINDEEHVMTAEERAELRRELREGLSEMDIELKEAMNEYRAAMIELRQENGGLTKISVECGDGDTRQEFKSSGGSQQMVICDSDIHASALAGLKEARAEIATNRDMPADVRAEVLQALDAKIAEWKSQGS